MDASLEQELKCLQQLMNSPAQRMDSNVSSSIFSYASLQYPGSTPLPSALQDLVSLETGMTPTPTNETQGTERSPKMDIATPKAKLYDLSGLTSTPTCQGSTPRHADHVMNTPSNDTSGFSTGTDWSSNNSSNNMFQTYGQSPTVSTAVHPSTTSELINTSSQPLSLLNLSGSPTSLANNNTSSRRNSSRVETSRSPLLSATRSSLAAALNSNMSQSHQPQISSGNTLFSPPGPITTSNHFLSNTSASILDSYLYNSTTSSKPLTSTTSPPTLNNQNGPLGSVGSGLDSNTLALLSLALNSPSSLTTYQLQVLLANPDLLAAIGAPSSGPPVTTSAASHATTNSNAQINNYLKHMEELNNWYYQELLTRQYLASQTPLSTLNLLNGGASVNDVDLTQLASLSAQLTNNSSTASGLGIDTGAVPIEPQLNATLQRLTHELMGYNSGTHPVSPQATSSSSTGSSGQSGSPLYNSKPLPFVRQIEDAATQYRNSATVMSQNREATIHWSGKLPIRGYKSGVFSRKVFLGGVPWDSTAEDLQNAFSRFGNVSVLWPQKENASFSGRSPPPKGYCYLIYEHEQAVRLLVNNCSTDVNGSNYFKISSPKFRSKDVQVIPWAISDGQFSRNGTHGLDNKFTVFIGALHGMITAEALFNIMQELFTNVTSASLDMDKYKYPIGSGRVTFSEVTSYVRAVTANFVDIRTHKFSKTIQIDPYLEDAKCTLCPNGGLYFCRAFECFSYFCPSCWYSYHNANETLVGHKPLRRTFKVVGTPDGGGETSFGN